MGRQLIGVRLEQDGPVVLAEVDAADVVDQGDAFARATDATARLEATARSVREALDSVVTPTARTLIEGLRQVAPDVLELEFGLKLSDKAGLVFASGEAVGHFNVKLSWQPQPPESLATTVAVPGG